MPNFWSNFLCFLWCVYSRIINAGSDVVAWVSHPKSETTSKWLPWDDVYKAQCVTLNAVWTATAWCLNGTTWTVLSLEIHWHLGFPCGKFPLFQCQLTHLSEEHLINNCMSATGSMPSILLITDVTLQFLDLFAVLRFWTLEWNYDWIHFLMDWLLY